MNLITTKIMEKLKETEQQNDVKIIYAIESGSRGWGFASPDSDYDCRFLYVHPKEWYLSVAPGKDFIEYPVDPIYDINGWDIKKALQLLQKSNPVLMEWLSSPIVYQENHDLIQEMRDLSVDFFYPTAACYHYLNLAQKSMQPIREKTKAKLKKYFYVLRPLACCQYILMHRQNPPMEYEKILPFLTLPPDILLLITELLEQKKKEFETAELQRIENLYQYMEESLQVCKTEINNLPGTRNKNFAPIDNYFRNVIEKAWS